MVKVNQLLEEERVDDALKVAKSRDVDLLLEKGISLMDSDDEIGGKAERVFRKILELDGKNLQAHNNLGVLLFRQGRYKEAKKEYKEAINVGLEYNEEDYKRGYDFQRKRRYKEAKEEYEKAMKVNYFVADARYNLGILLGKEKGNKEAESEYKTAMEIYVNYAESLTKEKISLEEENLSTEEIQEQILEVSSKLIDAHYNLGLFHHHQKKFKQARDEYKKAIELNVEYAQKLTEAKLELEGKGRKTTVEKGLIQQTTPRLTDAHYNLALTFQEDKKYPQAEKEYKKVLEMDSNYEDAHYNLGVLYERARKMSAARREYQVVLRINPGNKLAKERLRFLTQGKAKEK